MRTEILITGDKVITMRYTGLPNSENISFRVVGREEIKTILTVVGGVGLAMDGFGIDYSPALNLWLGVGLGNAGANPIMHITSPTAIPDPTSYTQRNAHNGNASQDYRGCCYAGGGVNGNGFVTVATIWFGGGSTFQAETTPDGINFTGENIPWDSGAVNNTVWLDVLYAGGAFDRLVAFGALNTHPNTVATKKVGEAGTGPAGAWQPRAALANTWICGAYSPTLGRIVAVGAAAGGGTSQTVITSDDGGLTWTTRLNVLPVSATWVAVEWCGDRFIALNIDAVLGANRMAFSSDGITWTASSSTPLNTWRSLAWSPAFNMAFCVALDGAMGLTTNGQVLIPYPGPSGQWTRVRWSDEQLRWGIVGRSAGTNRQALAR